MGGFRLLGPNYTIQSLRSPIMCKCPGFKDEITEELEQELINNPEKELIEFPLLTNGVHIGDNMNYRIISKSEDPDFEGERQRFRERKEKRRQERMRQSGYDTWTPWDGKSLESIATREEVPKTLDYESYRTWAN